jgi:hypothetical protein
VSDKKRKLGSIRLRLGPRATTRNLKSPMTRPFSPLVALLLLLVAPCLISAYSVELPAATKECFFEDLHTNDKVCNVHAPARLQTLNSWLQMTVTYQVGGGGHMDVDFWVCDPSESLMQRTTDRSPANRSRWTRTAQGRQTVNRHRFNHRKERRETRILLLKFHEFGLR